MKGVEAREVKERLLEFDMELISVSSEPGRRFELTVGESLMPFFLAALFRRLASGPLGEALEEFNLAFQRVYMKSSIKL